MYAEEVAATVTVILLRTLKEELKVKL